MRHFLYMVVICLSLLAAGCNQSSSEKTPAVTQTNTTVVTNPYLSANGEFITLKADNLTQHQIITFMSQQLGFEVKPTPPLDKTISVNLVNVTLREALQTVLSGNPYSVTLIYQSQVDTFPKLVTIATADKSASIQSTQHNSKPQNSTPSVVSTNITTAPIAIDEKQIQQTMRQFQNNVLANNPPSVATDPEFLEGMTGTKEDADKVSPLLKDPATSGEDKEAIINMLQEGEHDDVIEPLKTALQDKNPDVVKAAIEAIVFLGNENDVDTLKKLRDSTNDEDIRQAADDGITFLE